MSNDGRSFQSLMTSRGWIAHRDKQMCQGETTIPIAATKIVVVFPTILRSTCLAISFRNRFVNSLFRAVHATSIFQDWSMLIHDAKRPTTITGDSSLHRTLLFFGTNGALSRCPLCAWVSR